jgi:hypothetical protein
MNEETESRRPIDPELEDLTADVLPSRESMMSIYQHWGGIVTPPVPYDEVYETPVEPRT